MGLPRFSWVDLGAAVAVLGAAAGVVWSPKLTGAVAKATGALQPVQFSVDIKHTPSALDSRAPLPLPQRQRQQHPGQPN